MLQNITCYYYLTCIRANQYLICFVFNLFFLKLSFKSVKKTLGLVQVSSLNQQVQSQVPNEGEQVPRKVPCKGQQIQSQVPNEGEQVQSKDQQVRSQG